MKIYLDTSSLFKLYHEEEGTQELEVFFSKVKISHIYLSELTKVEFSSTIWKRVRTRDINIEQAEKTLAYFESDFPKYNFVTINSLILEQARKLLSKYGKEGLRSLDSIQLSTCIALSSEADVFITADTLLQNLIAKEGLVTKLPIH